MAGSYVAWNGRSYAGDPPDGWYRATDGRWWAPGSGPGYRAASTRPLRPGDGIDDTNADAEPEPDLAGRPPHPTGGDGDDRPTGENDLAGPVTEDDGADATGDDDEPEPPRNHLADRSTGAGSRPRSARTLAAAGALTLVITATLTWLALGDDGPLGDRTETVAGPTTSTGDVPAPRSAPTGPTTAEGTGATTTTLAGGTGTVSPTVVDSVSTTAEIGTETETETTAADDQTGVGVGTDADGNDDDTTDRTGRQTGGQTDDGSNGDTPPADDGGAIARFRALLADADLDAATLTDDDVIDAGHALCVVAAVESPSGYADFRAQLAAGQDPASDLTAGELSLTVDAAVRAFCPIEAARLGLAP